MKKTAILCFWLLVWQGLSMIVGNTILLVGPVEVAKSLITQAGSFPFWKTIFLSLYKIMAGFFAALLAGILSGSLSYARPFIKDFLYPVVSLIKSIPVASFVIMALIWLGSKQLSAFVSFLVVFPVIYENTMAGLGSTDQKLLEMAQVFQLSFFKKVYYLYVPALLPYLAGSCGTAIGMGIRSGVAAEVIGVPANSIGEQLYLSKVYLDTAGLLAWTLVIIVFTALLEKLIQFGINKARRVNQ